MPSVLKKRTWRIISILCDVCGVCLMPSPKQQRKIKTQFEIMSVPFFKVREDDSRGAKHGLTQWQYDHWKAKDAKKKCEEERERFYCGRKMKSIGLLKQFMAGQKNIVVTWTTLHLLTTWKERSRYENSPVLKLVGGLHLVRVTDREDFPQACSPTSASTGESLPEKRTRAITTIR